MIVETDDDLVLRLLRAKTEYSAIVGALAARGHLRIPEAADRVFKALGRLRAAGKVRTRIVHEAIDGAGESRLPVSTGDQK